MPRLSLPEPKIDIFADGFEKHKALLDRSAEGAQLSHLVSVVDDPVTIAVDGAWGAGKSHFLKCWVGEHLKTAEKTEMVYFDAFRHDYLDDPLVALSGALVDRFEDPTSKTAPAANAKFAKGLRKAAPKLGRLALRLGVSYVTAGIINRADDWVGADDDEAEEEAQETSKALTGTAGAAAQGAIDKFWQAEDGKRAAMAAFRDAICGWTEPDEKGHPTRRLVIVVDELDRCRPDYALNLLEIMKHFFDVAGVTFVLGTNMRAMQNHVVARYGAGVDAGLYLQKFVQVTMRLGEKENRFSNPSKVATYFEQVLVKMEINDGYSGVVKGYVRNLQYHSSLNLRGLQELARLCVLTPYPAETDEMRIPILIGGLMFLKAMRPEVLDRVLIGSAKWPEVQEALNLATDFVEHRGAKRSISEAWLLCFQDQKLPEFWQEHLRDDYLHITNSYS
ncbi:MAG: hypothetical protein KC439_11780 [Yoonia sp.]|nr:hypothetical protein [Yoonia sp.]